MPELPARLLERRAEVLLNSRALAYQIGTTDAKSKTFIRTIYGIVTKIQSKLNDRDRYFLQSERKAFKKDRTSLEYINNWNTVISLAYKKGYDNINDNLQGLLFEVVIQQCFDFSNNANAND
jgi:hypothetical protein